MNFKNTIIIMTSNLGSHLIQEQFDQAEKKFQASDDKWDKRLRDELYEQASEEAKKKVLMMLKETIRPEFLNRIDEIVMFSPLNSNEIRNIVKMQVGNVAKMLKDNGIDLRLTDAAIDMLAQAGFDPEFGARPVKRAIQRYLLNDLSKRILSGQVNRDKEIVVDANNDELTFNN